MTTIDPLVALTRESVTNLKTLRNHWRPEQDAAFIKAKELLTSAPVLHFLLFNKSFIIHLDASDCGVGDFLAQKENNEELTIIAYFRKRFILSQKYYSATQKRMSCSSASGNSLETLYRGAILFVLWITALFVTCIPCLIYLHGGQSHFHHTKL